MPYIASKRRVELTEAVRNGHVRAVNPEGDVQHPMDGGELNYLISALVDTYVGQAPLSYRRITEVRGALIGALSEFDRKIAWPYEDIKCAENGEVFLSSLRALEEARSL